jgi:hypothetical protein
MKYYVIQEAAVPVGLVFFEPSIAFYSIRAVLESLQAAFETAATTTCTRFIKDLEGLKVVTYGPSDPTWMDAVLGKLCSSLWSLGVSGNVLESEMDAMIDGYLGWSAHLEEVHQLQEL